MKSGIKRNGKNVLIQSTLYFTVSVYKTLAYITATCNEGSELLDWEMHQSEHYNEREKCLIRKKIDKYNMNFNECRAIDYRWNSFWNEEIKLFRLSLQYNAGDGNDDYNADGGWWKEKEQRAIISPQQNATLTNGNTQNNKTTIEFEADLL